jgi:hypothetical protein
MACRKPIPSNNFLSVILIQPTKPNEDINKFNNFVNKTNALFFAIYDDIFFLMPLPYAESFLKGLLFILGQTKKKSAKAKNFNQKRFVGYIKKA